MRTTSWISQPAGRSAIADRATGRSRSSAKDWCAGRSAGHAAIDEDFGAADVGGFVGGEEQDGVGDFLRLTDASAGNGSGDACFDLGQYVRTAAAARPDRSAGGAGGDDVHPDAGGGKL